MRDFFYKKNDIIIVLIILILAGFLIYNRINVILDYPAKLAEQQQAKAQSYRVVCPEAVTFEQDVHYSLAIDSKNGGVWGTGFGKTTINECLIGKNADGEIATGSSAASQR